MRNITGQAVVGDDLYGREYELAQLWERLERGEHILMLAPRRVGKTSLMLEIRRAPRRDWDVFYVDVESGEGPADCVAAILAELASDPRYRSRFQAIPFSNAIRGALGHLQSVSISTDVLRVEIKAAIGRDWKHAADQLRSRLTSLPHAGTNLLIIIDELPLLVSRMLHAPERKRDAEHLMLLLRNWRQAPDLRGRVHTLIGGSIGLEGVLRRAGLSGSINDLAPFRLDSWDRSTATKFLGELGRSCDFQLDDVSVVQMLDLLLDPVPYHVQLFFSALRDTSRGQLSNISPEVIQQSFSNRLAGASGTAHLDHYSARLEIALDEREHETAREILGRACRRQVGAAFSDIEDLRSRHEPTYLSVLRDLDADGYIKREDGRLKFRSNLLREWWRKYHGRELVS